LKKNWRRCRLVLLIGLHLSLIALATKCTPDTSSHGTFYLTVPTPGSSQVAVRDIEFFLDEPVGEGTFHGWVVGGGCDAIVSLCNGDDCEDVFVGFVNRGQEIPFEVDSEDSPVFSDYLDEFVPCYKNNEFASEPFSCQRWSCADSRHDITVVLDSACGTTLLGAIDVDYLDVRVPLLGLCATAAWLDDSSSCDGYDCGDLDEF
jgi:hypothetical protein